MHRRLDPTDRALLDNWQRDFPLVPQPYRAIAEALGLPEAQCIARLAHLAEIGAISRIGGTCRPNVAGASTLAAMSVPAERIEDTAAIIGAEEGVNHSYLRENEWNLWFVATGPDRAHVAATLSRIAARSHRQVLDLQLVRSFNVDLGFALDGSRAAPRPRALVAGVLRDDDRPILQALTTGLSLEPRPYAALADALGRTEADVMGRIGALVEAGVIGRLGVIVRHRALGWTANAMVVWQVPDAEVERAGTTLMNVPGVTLCYQRRTAGRQWPYNLYAMIHGQCREAALAVLEEAEAATGLGEKPSQVLFSVRCFKQRGALLATGGAP